MLEEDELITSWKEYLWSRTKQYQGINDAMEMMMAARRAGMTITAILRLDCRKSCSVEALLVKVSMFFH